LEFTTTGERGLGKIPRQQFSDFRIATKARNICEWGRDDAFFFLGIAYCEGDGVKKSIPTARRLFKRADIDGDHLAASRMLLQLQA
jgi:TPR repeat protein